VKGLLLIKYGEIALKGKNRPKFQRVLERNLRQALRGVGPFHLRSLQGRLVVEVGAEIGPEGLERMVQAASRVFGLVGVARASQAALDIEAIADQAVAIATEAVGAGARTFKVEVKRPNKGFPLQSSEIATTVGYRVLQAVPGLTVDVHEPELRIGIEIREDGAYLYGRETPGPGGLPLGTSGRAVALISGGIDSPVAIWMAMKRGLVTVPLHFWSYPFTGERAKQKVVDLCEVLRSWGLGPRLLVCPFTEIQTAIRDRCPEELGVTIMRRMMLRVATRVAGDEAALAIVTGESLGQVASQTLESLATIEAVTDLPVLRPLIGLDKEEIIGRARSIGTYDLSILPYEDCCTLFVPAHPRIKPTCEEAEAAETALDMEGLLVRAVEGIERVDGRQATTARLAPAEPVVPDPGRTLQ
jgi:thiamine biosynthesis protein ThiI